MNDARRNDFIALIRDASSPIAPAKPPELGPALEALVYPGASPGKGRPIGGIRAVLFDIYGTLFTSAAGDIGSRDGYQRGTELPEGVIIPQGVNFPQGGLDTLAREFVPGCTGEELAEYFREEVRRCHARLRPRIPYPEIKVEEIWAALFRGALARYGGTSGDPEEFALRYELAVNPVFPKPGIPELFEKLTGRGMVLGLVSNAQFFTPLLFEAFFNRSPEALGFDPGLLIYSFEMGEAKPSPVLFKKAADRLNSRGIAPDRVLFVGNDMLKDIYGAASMGFKTALFAGDGRSLRLREGNPLTEKLLPGGIIRFLSDIPAMIGC
ncbi:MAG: HAD hydrolase-like protein [Spirochaetaceae bacterium]|jgi:putative hydrolase of the HAD superfamily|nr:HAD hydrolase-like protein [Spirochaetaceae bacterium]